MSIHKFGKWHFDNELGEITCGDQVTRLEPTVSRLLVHFISNKDRLLTRDELMQTVWQGRVVSDDTINRAISLLRQAFNTADKAEIIKTVPRRGYIANFPPVDIDELTNSSSGSVLAQNAVARISRKSRLLRKLKTNIVLQLAVFGIFGLVLLLSGIAWLGNGKVQHDNPVIAVLRFVDNANSGGASFIGDGISENIISMLSTQQNLQVIARTSSFAVDQNTQSISQIAKLLNVDYVLEGSTQLLGQELRVNARLIDAKTELPVWSSSFVKSQDDVFSVQDDIAQSALIAIIGSLNQGKSDNYQPAFIAYQQLMLGKQALSLQTNEGINAAKQHFERAVELDSNYALAYVLVADAMRRLNQVNPFTQEYKRNSYSDQEILTWLQKALQRQPMLSEAHALRGQILLQQQHFTEAEIALSRAIRTNPNNADAYADIARLHQANNDLEKSIIAARKAVSLNPQDNSLNQLLATLLWQFGRAEEALSVVRRIAQINPSAANNNSLLSRWSLQMGDGFNAMKYALKEWQLELNNPDRHWAVCLMHVQIWDETSAIKCINNLLKTHPHYYEAKNFKLTLEGAQAKSLELTRTQVANAPHVVYFKLQLARKLNYIHQWDESIALMSSLYPDMLGSDFNINAINIWGARLLGHALLATGQNEQGMHLLDEIMAFLTENSMLQGGGFSSGVDDAIVLAILGEVEHAVDILEKRVNEGWIFYSQPIFFNPMPQALAQHARFIALEAKLRNNMKTLQKRVANELGNNLGFTSS